MTECSKTPKDEYISANLLFDTIDNKTIFSVKCSETQYIIDTLAILSFQYIYSCTLHKQIKLNTFHLSFKPWTVFYVSDLRELYFAFTNENDMMAAIMLIESGYDE